MKVIVLAADGTEETELIGIVDVLRRAEIDTKIVSVTQREITTAHGIRLIADALWNEVAWEEITMMVLPGGVTGVNHFKNDPKVIETIQKFNEAGKHIGAICAAPLVLQQAGILQGKKVVCYPKFEKEFNPSNLQQSPVVADKNIITGKSISQTLEFALLLVEQLKGKEKRNTIAQQMLLH